MWGNFDSYAALRDGNNTYSNAWMMACVLAALVSLYHVRLDDSLLRPMDDSVLRPAYCHVSCSALTVAMVHSTHSAEDYLCVLLWPWCIYSAEKSHHFFSRLNQSKTSSLKSRITANNKQSQLCFTGSLQNLLDLRGQKLLASFFILDHDSPVSFLCSAFSTV